MRYRRIHHRYALLVASPRAAFLDRWRAASPVVVAPAAWRPAADVLQTSSEVAVSVELAGVDPEDLEVILFEDALIVDGHRRARPIPDGVYHAAEIRQGRFRLEVALPASVDPDAAEARFERGLLELTLPKTGGNGPGR